jgi:hypothetical protein
MLSPLGTRETYFETGSSKRNFPSCTSKVPGMSASGVGASQQDILTSRYHRRGALADLKIKWQLETGR